MGGWRNMQIPESGLLLQLVRGTAEDVPLEWTDHEGYSGAAPDSDNP